MASVADVVEVARKSNFFPLQAATEAVASYLGMNEKVYCYTPVDFVFDTTGVKPLNAFVVITDIRLVVCSHPVAWTGEITFFSYAFAELTGDVDVHKQHHPDIDYTKPWNKPDIQFSWELKNSEIHGVFLRDEDRVRILGSMFDFAFNDFVPPEHEFNDL